MQKPSKLFPSSTADIAGSGVIDATNSNTFTAILDGSKPIVRYQVICRENDTDNQIVYNTGVQTPTTNPFYPVDTSGNIVPFNITVPATSATMGFEDAELSDADAKIVTIHTNVAAGLESGFTEATALVRIYLSTNGGASYNATDNPATALSFNGTSIQITFTSNLTSKNCCIKILNGTLKPTDSHYTTPAEDLITPIFKGKLADGLTALHLSTAYICAGKSFTATVEGIKDDYELNRSGVVSITMGGTEYASRVSDASKFGYSILSGTIYVYVGASVSAGTYTMSYTDNALSGTPKTVTATLVVAAANTLTYYSVETDSDRLVLTFNMTDAVTAAADFASKIQTSTDGSTWVATNAVKGVSVSNIAATYSQDASYTLSIEFTTAIADGTYIRFLAGAITDSNSTANAQFDTQALYFDTSSSSSSTTSEDVWAIVSNKMVNGKQYKWLLRVWSAYNTNSKESNMVESYEVAFDCYDSPTLSITGSSAITSKTGTWNGSYSQTQGVPLMWHQWTLKVGTTLVDDTGRVYSSVSPSYTYNGLLTDTTYTITLTCISQNGVSSSATFTSTVSYTELGVEGSVTATARSDGSICVTAKQADYITGQANGPYSFSTNTPNTGHTIVTTGASTTISFSSTNDFGVDWVATNTLVLRVHSYYDTTLLSYTADDGSFSCNLKHRGLVGGEAPASDLYPSTSQYPERGDYGEFVYTVNGVEVATYSTDEYGFRWYTIALTHTGMTVTPHSL